MKAGFALLALVAVAGAAPPPAPGGWDLVWSDEFDGSQIDPAKWGFETDCWGGGDRKSVV